MEVARRQYGVVSLNQFAAAGVSPAAVRAQLGRRVQRIHNGVFTIGHDVLRREGYWLAAVLACGPGAVLSHRSAGALHDLVWSGAARTDVIATTRRGRSRKGIRVHGCRDLPPDECSEVCSVPCTSVARTILDLAGVLDLRGVERLVERAERLELLDLYSISRLRARHRGCRGSARLRRVLGEWDEDLMRCESELEVLLWRLLARAGVERPVVNGVLEVGAAAYRVDFHWPESRYVVEADGAAFHDTPIAERRDTERDRALTGAGWRVDRLRWDDVSVRPERTLATVAEAVAGRLSPTSGG